VSSYRYDFWRNRSAQTHDPLSAIDPVVFPASECGNEAAFLQGGHRPTARICPEAPDAQCCLFSTGNLVSIGLFGLARIWRSAQ